jgi:hypothetical protein
VDVSMKLTISVLKEVTDDLSLSLSFLVLGINR